MNEQVAKFVSKISSTDKIISVVLFGSAARQELKPESDIDILIVYNIKNPEKSKEHKIVQKIAREITKEKPEYKNFQLIATNPSKLKKFDKDLLENIIKEGKILIGEPIKIYMKEIGFMQFVIFSFSLKKLSQTEKMRIKRVLYGFGKEEGLLKKAGVGLGKGCVLVRKEFETEIESVLERNKADFIKISVWSEPEKLEFLKLKRKSF